MTHAKEETNPKKEIRSKKATAKKQRPPKKSRNEMRCAWLASFEAGQSLELVQEQFERKAAGMQTAIKAGCIPAADGIRHTPQV